MAKGARASSKKTNRTALRARVFGPQEAERLERLARKQQEIAAAPKPEKTEMQIDAGGEEAKTKEEEMQDTNAATREDMEVDGAEKPNRRAKSKRKENRISKRRHRKVQNRMTFPTVKQRRTVSRVSNR